MRVFAPAVTLGSTSSRPFGDGKRDGYVALALGGGVIYVTYFSNKHTLKLKRSIDGGASWLGRQTLSSVADAYTGASVAAGPDDAVVTYSTYDTHREWLAALRSGDDGAHWAGPRRIESMHLPWSGSPVLIREPNGIYLVLYSRCEDGSCKSFRLMLGQSRDGGATWPILEPVGGSSAYWVFGAGIAWMGWDIIMYGKVTNRGKTINIYSQVIEDLSPPPPPT